MGLYPDDDFSVGFHGIYGNDLGYNGISFGFCMEFIGFCMGFHADLMGIPT